MKVETGTLLLGFFGTRIYPYVFFFKNFIALIQAKLFSPFFRPTRHCVFLWMGFKGFKVIFGMAAMPFLCKGLIYYHSHEAWIPLILTLNSTSFPLPYIKINFYFAKCNLAFYLTWYNIVCHNIFSNNENAEIIQFSLWLLLWYFWLETYGGFYLIYFF